MTTAIKQLIAAGVLLITVQSAGSAGAIPGPRPEKGLIEVRNDNYPVVIAHAVERLRAYSPIPLDMSCSTDPRVHPELYALTLLVGVTGNDPDLEEAWGGKMPESDEAWALKTLSKSPLTIAVTGNRPRAVLYAAYRLADEMKLGRNLAALDETHAPRIGERETWLNATAIGAVVPRNSQFMSTVNELPRYGLNGVMMVPGDLSLPPATPGHESLPLVLDQNATIRVDEARRLEWMTFLDAIKSYDMNVTLTADPLIPPGTEPAAVEAFLKTGKIPAQYLEKLRVFYGEFTNKLLNALPQIDAIALTPGVEGAMYNQEASFPGVRLFLDGQDLHACSAVMSVYFDVVTRIAKARGKRVVFWIHSYGTTSDGLRAMWNLAAQYPGVVRMGEDYWPNELWPNGGTRLKIMAYLPPDVRAHFDDAAPLGALAVTDAECDGDGAMPNAYADQYVYSAAELMKHKAVWVSFRLDQWDWTAWGTLWNVSGIEIEQFANAVWTNARTPQQVWDEWIERRWGKSASPFVSAALAKSGEIIHDGFLVDGINMFHHSTIGPRRWTPSDPYSYESDIFHMFARPGQLIYTKGPEASRLSYEQWPAQLHAKTVSIEDFRQQQARATHAVDQALAELDKASPFLSRPDDDYLHSIFTNAGQVIRVFSALAEMAYAVHLLRDNYAGVSDPQTLFEKDVAAVEQLAGDPAIEALSFPFAFQFGREEKPSDDSMKRNLLQIVALYRNYARTH